MRFGRSARYELNRDKFLSESEVQSFEAVLKRMIALSESERDALLMLICLHTGGRANEVLNLKKSDFDPKNHSLYLRGLKGSMSREIPVPRWVGKILERFCVEKYPNDRIFPITYNRLRQIWLLYRPAQKKLHALRHTFAMRLYLKHRDVRLLQLALGHRSVGNTMIYIEFVYTLTDLQRLIRKGG